MILKYDDRVWIVYRVYSQSSRASWWDVAPHFVSRLEGNTIVTQHRVAGVPLVVPLENAFKEREDAEAEARRRNESE